MKINIAWNSGCFTLTHSADIPEHLIPIVLAFGVKHLVQRNSKHDKVLGCMTKVRAEAAHVPGSSPKGDGPWRRKGWKRGDVAFTPALADALCASYAGVTLSEDEDGEAEVLPLDTTATQYDGAASAEPKYAREKKKLAEKESTPDGLSAWLALTSFTLPGIGEVDIPAYAGETHGEDGEFHPDALANCKAKLDAVATALAAVTAKSGV